MKLEGDKNLLVTNDISGEVIGVVLKGENQLDRVKKCIQAEFDSEKVYISNIEESKHDGISFEVELDTDTIPIKLLRAFIY